ncbi:DNA recombination protein RmuC [Saccharicrinis fermentans]|uniref:DNA recombination protein RmuC n=1 Tax=Saccharicrinis fermentans DSM 9555 = JCM 21142 TaxID=869213 RepID=W7XUN1_9BACT|nr:DNA recombination protein RmuC [Saccharicrinis fermentans]GAF01730.1 DNA recombination protein RmuC [Saccharicrinis fermentans DSM 9555 = JCM 21142]
MDITQITIGFIAGATLASIIVILFFNAKKNQLSSQHIRLELEGEQLRQNNTQLSQELNKVKNELIQARLHVTAVDTENTHLIKSNREKIHEVKELQDKLTLEFENIANRVLRHRSQEISEQNQQKLSDILTPLKEKIQQFEKKVEDTYDKEVRDKLSLQAEVKRLFELNHKISQEAGNLTRALKGDVKQMGNWGEMILERVLEQSGLSRGREYRREVDDKNAEGRSIRPDVIIDLPENKHLIIDSKLSLIAYDQYVNAESKEQQILAIKKHKASLREHIKGLHEKNYASAANINSPDFVLMFIPVEASFAVAIEADNDLFTYAWDRKIVPVTPSTLLATLKTISSIWKQENQTKNAHEIAKQSGALYDKLVNFLVDLDKIGQNINQLQSNYAASMQKLQNGRGNLISKAQKIKELGAKTNKIIPDKFIPE